MKSKVVPVLLAGRTGDQGHTFVLFLPLEFLAGFHVSTIVLNVLVLVNSSITESFFSKKKTKQTKLHSTSW